MLTITTALITMLLAAENGSLTPDDVAGLTLTISVPSRISTGQPTKATVTMSSTRALDVGTEALHVLIDAGNGFERFAEARGSVVDYVEVPRQLLPGAPEIHAFVLGVAGGCCDEAQQPVAEPAFPRPGTYQVVAEYAGLVRSNVATVMVADPDGPDGELYFEHLRPRPVLLSTLANNTTDRAVLQGLLDQYTSRNCLARPQLMLWTVQIGTLLGVETARDQLVQILDGIEHTSWPDNVFDEDRLLLVAKTRTDIGDEEGAERAFREIIETYPAGAPATAARK